MATRTQSREAATLLVYAYDTGNDQNNAQLFLEERKIRNKQQEFALNLFNGVIEQKDALDSVICEFLKDWELHKLGGMERSILRVGAYEIMHTDTDIAIVINEAIELAKNYGADASPKLINGILDNVAKIYRKPKNSSTTKSE